MGKKQRTKKVPNKQVEHDKLQIKENLKETNTTGASTNEFDNDQIKRHGIWELSKPKDKRSFAELVKISVKSIKSEYLNGFENDISKLSDVEKIDGLKNDSHCERADTELLDLTPESLCKNDPSTNNSIVKNAPTKNKQSSQNGYILNDIAKNKTNTDEQKIKQEALNNNKNVKDAGESGINDSSDSLFPKHLEWVIFVLTLLFRLWYVANPLNWWVLHPDEIYQTMEVAHSEVYGYGFRAYEYLAPPDPGWENVTSELRQYEISKGMYSLRSFLLPKILAVVMSAGEVVAPDMSPYLVVKFFHVVVTSLLPLAVYRFSLAIHQSRDCAILSTILVCSSTTLNVFGTHTLSNSFIAPVLFYTLAPLIEILKWREPYSKAHHSVESSNKVYHQNGYMEHLDIQCSGGKVTLLNTNGRVNGTHTKNGHIHYEYLVDYIIDTDQNGNSLKQRLHEFDHTTIKHKNGLTKPGKNGYNNGFCIDKKETHHEIFEKGKMHTDGENLRRPKTTEGTISLVKRFYRPLKYYILGLFLSLCVYMRPDCVILPALCVIIVQPAFLANMKWYILKAKYYLLGFVTGTLIGGYEDHVMYGNWFLSPVQWFRFNVLKNGSSDVFGTQSLNFYLVKLVELEPWTLYICSIFVIDILIALKASKFNSTNQNQNSVHLMLICFFILYSLLGHKEYRFFHNAVVLMYIAFSESFLRVSYKAMRLFMNQNNCLSTYFIILFIAIFTSSHIYKFLTIRDSSLSNWTYGGKVGTNEVNICLDFIRKQDDVRGVYVQHEFYMFGGYTVLHKNVSIIARNQHNIFVYSISDRVCSVDPNGNLKSLALFSRISEFISPENSLFLAKTLINNKQFNYVIVPSNNEFIQTGYHEVFNIGNTSVLKRTFIAKEETELKKIAEAIPIGRNSTVMEYEGYWLFRFGLYAKAERRLLISNRLDPKRIGPFQLLRNLFHKLGNTANLKKVLEACVQVHTREKCNGRYTSFELN